MAQIVFWYRKEVEAAASIHGIDPDLVHAICLVESSGLTYAYRFEPKFWDRYLKNNPSYAGTNPARVSASYGLMQVMFPTAVDHGMPITAPPEALFVPEIGLEWGCRVLDALLKWSGGNAASAVAAYNGGKVGNAPGQPGGALRNSDYMLKVAARYAQLTGRTGPAKDVALRAYLPAASDTKHT